MSITPFYIYRHIRPDKNEVFYIGKGNNLDKRVSAYCRSIAQSGTKRSSFWKKVVAINGGDFISEIIYECETEDECNEKEKEFIALYGRKNLNKGTLVNLTDGGDGHVGAIYPKEWLKKRADGIRGEKHPYFGKFPPNSKKVINVETCEKYEAITEAAKSANMSKGLLEAYLMGRRVNKSPFIYLSTFLEIGEAESRKLIRLSPKPLLSRSIPLIDVVTGKEYANAKQAANDYGVGACYLREMLRGKYPNKTNLRYKK